MWQYCILFRGAAWFRTSADSWLKFRLSADFALRSVGQRHVDCGHAFAASRGHNRQTTLAPGAGRRLRFRVFVFRKRLQIVCAKGVWIYCFIGSASRFLARRFVILFGVWNYLWVRNTSLTHCLFATAGFSFKPFWIFAHWFLNIFSFFLDCVVTHTKFKFLPKTQCSTN